MMRARRIAKYVGVITVLVALTAGMAYGGSYPRAWPVAFITNGLLCLPAYLCLQRWLGRRQAVSMLVALGLYAFLFEAMAVKTGWPYGSFGYSDLLGPKVFGLVPLPVFFAWTPLIVGVAALAWRIPGRLPRAATTAVGLVVVDLILDPGAVALGYWGWSEPGPYYGVPAINFFGWLISGGIAAVVLVMVTRKGIPTSAVRPAGMGLAAIVGLWTMVDLWRGLYWAALMGAFGLAVIGYALQSARKLPDKPLNRV